MLWLTFVHYLSANLTRIPKGVEIYREFRQQAMDEIGRGGWRKMEEAYAQHWTTFIYWMDR